MNFPLGLGIGLYALSEDKSTSLEPCAAADEIQAKSTHTNIQDILDMVLVLVLKTIRFSMHPTPHVQVISSFEKSVLSPVPDKFYRPVGSPDSQLTRIPFFTTYFDGAQPAYGSYARVANTQKRDCQVEYDVPSCAGPANWRTVYEGAVTRNGHYVITGRRKS